jgi:predicted MPP superfamily phosphohydrolase
VHWSSEEAKKENMDELYAFFERVGWKLLNNENHVFESASGSLALLGVENWGANPRFPKLGDIDKALKGAENADVKILMTHDPTHWDKVIVPEKYQIDLSLSGHTHGFQFGIEIPGIKWSPAKWMYKHWAGLYLDEPSGMYLYVNRGIGSIGYPGRIGILPEITLIELV